jgi:hypothetical protein
MENAELVLRFFALRNIEHYQMEMPDFLDLYMTKSLKLTNYDRKFLEDIFTETIKLAHKVYGNNLFKPFDPQSQTWCEQSNRSYYDVTMLGFNKRLPDAHKFFSKNLQNRVIEATKNLFNQTGSSFFDRRWNK